MMQISIVYSCITDKMKPAKMKMSQRIIESFQWI